MKIAGRPVGVDSIVCGQKIQTPVCDSLSPYWHHTVLYMGVSLELSVSVNQSSISYHRIEQEIKGSSGRLWLALNKYCHPYVTMTTLLGQGIQAQSSSTCSIPSAAWSNDFTQSATWIRVRKKVRVTIYPYCSPWLLASLTSQLMKLDTLISFPHQCS